MIFGHILCISIAPESPAGQRCTFFSDARPIISHHFMDLRQIRYFLVVAEEQNIGRAAQVLHISQPPLTRQIQALEYELGVQLFLRTPKGVELTQAGAMFKEETTNICLLIDAAIERARRAGEGRLGRLDVGIFGSAIYGLIPKLLQDFNEKHPAVSIVLHTMNETEQIEALRQRRITVAFDRMTPRLPDIGRELIATERLIAVIPVDHPLAQMKAVPLRALAQHPLVLYPSTDRPNFADHVLELFKQEGLEPILSQKVGDAVTSIALVARDFGVTLIPESAAVSLQVQGTTYRPLADAPQAVIDLCCLYLASDQSPLLQSFLAVVREHLSKSAHKPAITTAR